MSKAHIRPSPVATSDNASHGTLNLQDLTNGNVDTGAIMKSFQIPGPGSTVTTRGISKEYYSRSNLESPLARQSFELPWTSWDHISLRGKLFA